MTEAEMIARRDALLEARAKAVRTVEFEGRRVAIIVIERTVSTDASEEFEREPHNHNAEIHLTTARTLFRQSAPSLFGTRRWSSSCTMT